MTGRPYPVPNVCGISRAITYGALFEHLTCPKTMIRFTTAEGAGAHCQCGADRLSNARIFDWLDDTFGLAVKP